MENKLDKLKQIRESLEEISDILSKECISTEDIENARLLSIGELAPLEELIEEEQEIADALPF